MLVVVRWNVMFDVGTRPRREVLAGKQSSSECKRPRGWFAMHRTHSEETIRLHVHIVVSPALFLCTVLYLSPILQCSPSMDPELGIGMGVFSVCV